MNYRHAFHAGNFADVLKHAVLTLIIERLKRKEAGFVVVDCHAGIGRYDLMAAQAEKTGEWRGGIGRLLAAQPLPALAPYLEVVRALNPQGELRCYPGSPRLARQLLRPQDRLALIELHPADVAVLRREFARDRQVSIRHDDAYIALKALLPPRERRGVVLIDPPFEAKDEFARILRGLRPALERWEQGCYAVWYPIKNRAPIERFHGEIAMLGVRPVLLVELMLHAEPTPDRLNGCGLIILRPPWRLDALLGDLLPGLTEQLGGAGWRLDWLVGE